MNNTLKSINNINIIFNDIIKITNLKLDNNKIKNLKLKIKNNIEKNILIYKNINISINQFNKIMINDILELLKKKNNNNNNNNNNLINTNSNMLVATTFQQFPKEKLVNQNINTNMLVNQNINTNISQMNINQSQFTRGSIENSK